MHTCYPFETLKYLITSYAVTFYFLSIMRMTHLCCLKIKASTIFKEKSSFNFMDRMIHSTSKKQVEKENPKYNVYYSVISLASICKRILHL